jgi:hypothetical protein
MKVVATIRVPPGTNPLLLPDMETSAKGVDISYRAEKRTDTSPFKTIGSWKNKSAFFGKKHST